MFVITVKGDAQKRIALIMNLKISLFLQIFSECVLCPHYDISDDSTVQIKPSQLFWLITGDNCSARGLLLFPWIIDKLFLRMTVVTENSTERPENTATT